MYLFFSRRNIQAHWALKVLELWLLKNGSDYRKQGCTARFTVSFVFFSPPTDALSLARAEDDYNAPDCRFINIKKGQLVYIYAKLVKEKGAGEFWAGSVRFMSQCLATSWILFSVPQQREQVGWGGVLPRVLERLSDERISRILSFKGAQLWNNGWVGGASE